MPKKALLVGVNDYQGVSDLNGCVNDVTNMRSILRTYFGFQNSEIRVLTDKRATKANILSRLRWLTKDAKRGDYLVFHFSGHGSQIRDRDKDEELTDQLDELICPHDMNWTDGYLLDDHLNAIFRKLPEGVSLEVFLDCCHSGTGLRAAPDLGRPADLGPEHPTRIRYLPPPPDILCRVEGEEDTLSVQRLLRGDKAVPQHILWAGCRSDQTSADAYIDGAYNGAFTYYFCKHVRDSDGRLNRQDLLKRLRASLRHNGYSQIPQLESQATVRALGAFHTDSAAKTAKAK
ncbi:MAG: caspase family protein [Acidobacteriota bacterium]